MEDKQQFTMLNTMKKALEWWDNFTTEEKNDIEREHGYYGHDIGTAEEDVLYFYTQRDRIPNIKDDMPVFEYADDTEEPYHIPLVDEEE